MSAYDRDQSGLPWDSLNEECGVFGISSLNQDVARLTFFGLSTLQHRGQESAGIAVSDGRGIRLHKDMGLVLQIFNEAVIEQLKGHLAVGHTRYSTTGASNLNNALPLLVEGKNGSIALVHNGNLVNTASLRFELLERGAVLQSTSDSEIMTIMLAAAPGESWMERIQSCMEKWIGAYSLVILTVDKIYAARDPWGIRPLTIGQLPGGGHVVSSETGALETVGCVAIREIEPGEVVALHRSALIVKQAIPAKKPLALCTFEHIYFSRPDSIWDGRVVSDVRFRLGQRLAEESPVEADVVIPVPDSSIPAGLGYADQSGIPYNVGLIKNRYIGRTFIQPSQDMRKRGVFLKFNPLPSVLRGKRVVLVDDSIVRGTTMPRLVSMIREAGAEQVHVRITCPPLTHPCFMGVDMPTHDELIAHHKTVAQVCDLVGADSLHYLSLEGMMEAIASTTGYCNACFTGKYPFPQELLSIQHAPSEEAV